MKISKAVFIKSADGLKTCPPPKAHEFAFIGRSNVGKSSLINMLTGNGKLAKVSATPGKTQTLNFFNINDRWNLVDLPGYGYAKTGKSKREGFASMIIDYCTKRDSLVCLFVLLDLRLPLQKIDLEFLTWCGEKNVPFCIIYTKADKLSKSEQMRNMQSIENELLKHWDELPNTIMTSAEKGMGKEDVLDFIGYHLTHIDEEE